MTVRASLGVRELQTRAEVLRAARALLRAHPEMAALWRMLAVALEREPAAAGRFADALDDQVEASADDARWLIGRRPVAILTHSASSAVEAAVVRLGGRVARVVCTASLPGGEGRAFARRLGRAGFDTSVVADAEVARAAASVDLVLVGADAVTETHVVNKVGTTPVTLAAAHVRTPCYAVASSAKCLPMRYLERHPLPLHDRTELALFDAVLTERGPRRAAGLRRMVGAVSIPPALSGIRART